ncbi:T6SS immunity protein Tdi1 domain-containing protein [Sphingomonas aerophila]|uniref:T6SS immunity protein Tdi1 C-terminal domain-containing protein n=1 Tax=Sphingomonas aerophila TaxID=1344948 RepID=A0A7W9BGM8_9SPHN|nr:T6SS immunity protein Tdi1 domain-containing protein [Sphingomonas aerophila]MBB5716792.1 hypothetical protein [Sphingomonas aerophila]
MSATDYFLQAAADDEDLSAWASILPSHFRVFRTSLFGDSFLVDSAGEVHMLERAGCSVQRIAVSEEGIWRQVEDDAEGWQLRRLADECRRAGKVLAAHQCYAFTTPPVLGGAYSSDNVWVAPWREWFSFTADLFRQIQHLPDGATVHLTVVD